MTAAHCPGLGMSRPFRTDWGLCRIAVGRGRIPRRTRRRPDHSPCADLFVRWPTVPNGVGRFAWGVEVASGYVGLQARTGNEAIWFPRRCPRGASSFGAHAVQWKRSIKMRVISLPLADQLTVGTFSATIAPSTSSGSRGPHPDSVGPEDDGSDG